MALKAEMWVEAAMEGGRLLMATWRKEEGSGQTSPDEERANEAGEVVIAHGSVEVCEATPIGLADELMESLYRSEADRDLRNADLRSA